MGLFNFHLPKNNKFDYRPRYYDERKERLEEMKKKYGKDDADKMERRQRIRFERNYRRENIFMKTGIRFMIILAVLLVLVFIVAKYFDIPLF